MKNKELSIIETYLRMVYKVLIIGIPTVALFAAATISIIKVLGFYPGVSTSQIAIFDSSCILYFAVGAFFINYCEDSDGNFKTQALLYGKIFIGIVEIVQWNFLSYMIPSRDFWAYSLFFILLTVFFVDSKFTAAVIGLISFSIVLSWIIKSDVLLPIQDSLFAPEFILRIVLLLLSFFALWLLTKCIEQKMARELENVADFDTLTMLYNRRTLDFSLEKAYHDAQKIGKPFSVAMCDLDNFKEINDKFGHECGDEVLKKTANVLARTLGTDGLFYRYGGEELLAIIYQDEDTAKKICAKMCKNVENNLIEYGDTKIFITVTVGIASYISGLQNVEEIVKRADMNLYFGKNHGKNQVVQQ